MSLSMPVARQTWLAGRRPTRSSRERWQQGRWLGTIIGPVVLILVGLIAGPSNASYGFDNGEVATQARSYALGSYGDQCKVFAENVVNAVLSRHGISARVGGYASPNGAYWGAYANAGGVRVDPSSAAPGDLVQINNPKDRFSNIYYTGMHTAIVVGTTGSPGTFVVRDSNWMFTTTVKEHTWNPTSYVQGKPLEANFWRFGSVGSGPGSGSAAPFGAFDTADPASNGIHVRGWAIDPDTNNPIDVHVYVDSAGYATTANVSRPDVDAVYHRGANHGFDFTVPVGPGTHNVCAYGINYGGGTNPQLGCKAYTTPVPIVGDLTGDSLVNCADVHVLQDAWGTNYSQAADLNHDGTVDVKDLSILLSHWTGPNDGTC